MPSSALVWFRRDLRDFDHAALYHALKECNTVYTVFVFDTTILDKLTHKEDRRVEFIWESIEELKTVFHSQQHPFLVLHGDPKELLPSLAKHLNVDAVYCNHDYEPEALARDTQVEKTLSQLNIQFHSYKDQVLFEKSEVLTQTGKPYGVFTPYKNSHLKQLNDFYLKSYPVDCYRHHLANITEPAVASTIHAWLQHHPSPTSLNMMGFKPTNLREMKLPTGMSGGKALFEDFTQRMRQYKEARDFPGVKGVSYLSVHLRFGTVSIRHLARTAFHQGGLGAETWLNELIWRDFYFQILHHRPDLANGRAYKAEYESLAFQNNTSWFQAWCEGNTGYPIVDAAMRQLNQTGYMHNRLRMITASFLVKDLLIDWRWGERYFAQQLIDYDFAANNGGWQWAASTGCDAQPYFRIFNPVSQSEKFDPQGKFIRKYLPELQRCSDKEIHAPWLIPPLRLQSLGIILGKEYPHPIVNHSVQREKALSIYKQASKNSPKDTLS